MEIPLVKTHLISGIPPCLPYNYTVTTHLNMLLLRMDPWNFDALFIFSNQLVKVVTLSFFNETFRVLGCICLRPARKKKKYSFVKTV